MSTRSQRTADKSLNQKHAKILKACLDRPENKYCADCKKKGLF
jgi:stromal membrane-associated protein